MAYELATSINLTYDRTGKQSFLQSVERIINAGFTNLDYNFLDMMNGTERFWGDDYKEWMYECKEFAEKRGAKWVQAHSICSGYQKGYKGFIESIRRSIECCAYLGIDWTVCHPVFYPCLFHDDSSVLEFNYRMFSELLETAEKYHVGIAIENNTHDPLYPNSGDNTSTEELIEFVDSFKSDYIGICWDVGHANVSALYKGYEHVAISQSTELKKVGHRLKATHIHDNNAKRVGIDFGLKLNGTEIDCSMYDEHIQPYMGTVDWDDIIYGLDSIHYNHFFTYETHNSTRTLPDELVDDKLVFLCKLGQYLVGQSKL